MSLDNKILFKDKLYDSEMSGVTGDEFSEWIEQQLSQRGWKASDLAREAGLDQGTLSNVLNGARRAGLAFCTRVAAALNLPPEAVLRQAGLLPSVPDMTATGQEMDHLFAQLSPDDQRRALVIVRVLLLDGAHSLELSESPGTTMEEASGRGMGAPGGGDLEDHFLDRAAPRPGRRPAALVIALLVLLGVFGVGAVVGMLGVAFLEGSWWYAVATDRALDAEGRTRIAAVRERVAKSGSAPQAVEWLDLALTPSVHPSDVWAYLVAARGELIATDDEDMVTSIGELDALINIVRPTLIDAPSLSPFPISTIVVAP